jgi:riboflavin synthase
MFSGIVEQVGELRSVDRKDQALILEIETGFESLGLGESIAVNGVCLTVTRADPRGGAVFYVSRETNARSNLGSLVVGNKVNLERAVTLNTRLSGHLVQGHVDGKASLIRLEADESACRLEFLVPDELARFCVEKGSITLDGISLTLNGLRRAQNAQTVVQVTIIGHTWTHTNLDTIKIGDEVNVEIDIIAKYVESLCQPYLKP